MWTAYGLAVSSIRISSGFPVICGSGWCSHWLKVELANTLSRCFSNSSMLASVMSQGGSGTVVGGSCRAGQPHVLFFSSGSFSALQILSSTMGKHSGMILRLFWASGERNSSMSSFSVTYTCCVVLLVLPWASSMILSMQEPLTFTLELSTALSDRSDGIRASFVGFRVEKIFLPMMQTVAPVSTTALASTTVAWGGRGTGAPICPYAWLSMPIWTDSFGNFVVFAETITPSSFCIWWPMAAMVALTA